MERSPDSRERRKFMINTGKKFVLLLNKTKKSALILLHDDYRDSVISVPLY